MQLFALSVNSALISSRCNDSREGGIVVKMKTPKSFELGEALEGIYVPTDSAMCSVAKVAVYRHLSNVTAAIAGHARANNNNHHY